MNQRSTRQVNQNLIRKPDSDLESIFVTVAAPYRRLIPAGRFLSPPELHRPRSPERDYSPRSKTCAGRSHFFPLRISAMLGRCTFGLSRAGVGIREGCETPDSIYRASHAR